MVLSHLLDMLPLPSNHYGGNSYYHPGYEDYHDVGYSSYHNDHGAYSGGGGYGHSDCCPLVVDPLTYIALLSFLAIATYFLQQLIIMSMLSRKKRSVHSTFLEGKLFLSY